MKEHKYYVYIMASKSRRLYTGITNDVYRRSLEHKSGEIDGFTKKYKINRLLYYEVFKYGGNAIAREKEIKGWDRAKRVALIESENPTWGDLAAEWGKPFPLGVAPRAEKRETFAFSRSDSQHEQPREGEEKQIPRRFAPRDDNPKQCESGNRHDNPKQCESGNRDDNPEECDKSELINSKVKV